MEKIQNFRAGNAREQIFIPPRKPHHFMREDRTDDQDLIVIEKHPIDLHWHIHGEKPIREPADLG